MPRREINVKPNGVSLEEFTCGRVGGTSSVLMAELPRKTLQ